MIKFQVSLNNRPYRGRFGFLAKIIVMTLAILLSGLFLSTIIHDAVIINSVWAALLASVVIALLNAFLRPILVVLTLPFTIFSMGFFMLFINAFIVYLSSHIIDGFAVKNFWWAMLLSIIITLISGLLEIPERLLSRRNKKKEEEPEKGNDDFFDDYEDLSKE